MPGGGIPSLIMRKTVDIDMVTFTRYRHWREILTEVKWQKRWTLFHRFLSLYDFDIFRRRNDESICHVSDDLIRHHKNWCPKLLGHVERFHREVEHLLDTVGSKCDNLVVAVGSPSDLHHVCLTDQGRQTRTRSAPLNINDNARCLGDDAKPYAFHHQGETRT